jgi:hypothetical protein
VNEKTWTTESGHTAVVLFVRDSHRCGYVGIRGSNALHGKAYGHELPKEYRDRLEGQAIGKRGIIPIFCMGTKEGVPLDVWFDVHGGLTYANSGKEYPVENDGDLWWFGFDCAHSGDKTGHSPEGEERTLEYCIAECESLSRQLKEFE